MYHIYTYILISENVLPFWLPKDDFWLIHSPGSSWESWWWLCAEGSVGLAKEKAKYGTKRLIPWVEISLLPGWKMSQGVLVTLSGSFGSHSAHPWFPCFSESVQPAQDQNTTNWAHLLSREKRRYGDLGEGPSYSLGAFSSSSLCLFLTRLN